MAIETRWPAVAPQAFTSDGTSLGVVTVANTAGFKVKQTVVIQSTSPAAQIQVQVKRVNSPTQLIVGPLAQNISPTYRQQGNQLLSVRSDISGFTVASGAFIYAEEQPKAVLDFLDILRAVYRQEPGTTIGVEIDDQFGTPIDSILGSDGLNRLAVQAQLKVESIEIGTVDQGMGGTSPWLVRTSNDTNYGIVGPNTIRTASQIGNATGAADFGTGIVSNQTLRVMSLLYDSAANGISSTLLGGKQALDVNIANDTFQVDVGTPDQSTFTYGSSIEQAIGGVFQDTGASLLAGQSGAVRLTQFRAFHTNLRNSSGTELDYNFGSASASTLRVAALVGNASGSADFNSGVTGAQTLRSVVNIQRNGNELSYNSGVSDSNTIRTSSNLKREGNDLDYNYGVVDANTLRTASQIGNSAGAADFNFGATGSQTLRTTSNLSDGSGNKLTSTLLGGKQALDVNIANDTFQVDVGTPDQSAFIYGSSIQQAIGGVFQDTSPGLSAGQTGAVRLTQFRAFHTNLRTSGGTELDYNFGAASANSLRIASLIGNATGAADFNSGSTGAQTLRSVVNIQRNGNELSYNVGIADTNTLRVAALIANATGVVDYNYGTVGAQTIRTASQIGNATGGADFNEGVSGAQTLRVSANIARNGNELSYNAGVSDANTLRTSSNLKREGNDLDYNFGAASANSLRIASLIGNATGSADFNSGSTTAQTLRSVVNIQRSGNELSYNNGASDSNTLRTASNIADGNGTRLTSTLLSGKQALDVNIANDTFQVEVGTADETLFTYGSSIQQPIGGVYQDGSPSVIAGQTAAARITQNRAFHVNLRNSSGAELDYNFGTASSATSRVAALVGNATGSADFGAGATSAQTLRSVVNIQRNGNELSYNVGSLDANTLRVAAILANASGAVDYNYGTVGAQTVRIASQVGNTTGSADFNFGTVGAQTLRVASLIGNATGAADFGAGSATAQTLRSTVSNFPTTVDINYGTVGVSTIRSAAQVGNSTGAADFNAGATGAQTLRTSSNIQRNGNELSYNIGAADANTLRVAALMVNASGVVDYNYGTIGAQSLRAAAQLGNATGALDYNYGTVGAQTLRSAAQIGNATGAADFNSGSTTAQTLRVASNLYDSTGTGVTLGQKAAASSLPVVTQSDAAPATQNITIQDSASVNATEANAQIFVTGTPTAGSAASFSVSSFESVEVLVTGTWTGTLQTEFSIDGGTTWFTRGLKQAGVSYISSSFTANFAGGANISGATNYRVRATATMTGTATVKIVTSVNSSSVTVTNPGMLRDSVTQSILNTIKAASTAAAVTDTAIVVAQSPNTPTPAGTNLIGEVALVDGLKATYSCAMLGLTAPTTPTDLVTIQGSATKTIRILKITIDAVQNTSGTRDILLIKRSAANTGGTSSSQTIVPHDSNNAGATAVIAAYTVNATSLGTDVGNVRVAKIQQLATNVTNPLDHIVWDFGNKPGQALVLRGTSQFLAINLNGITSSNNSFDINIEFTEE